MKERLDTIYKQLVTEKDDQVRTALLAEEALLSVLLGSKLSQ